MTGLRKTRTGIGLGLVLALATAVAATLGAGGAGSSQQSAFALPRPQTLYMSGNQWSPNNDLNPAKNWDYITGLVSRKGRELGIPTPANDAVLEIDRAINEGRVPMRPENFDLLKDRIRASSAS